jgi:hypothetical protein
MHRSTTPYWVQDPRAVIHELAAQRNPDEPIHVLYWAQPSLRFYDPTLAASPRVHFGSEHRLWNDTGARDRPPARKPDVATTLEELRPLTAAPRFWVLFAHMDAHEPEFLAAISVTFPHVPVEVHKRRGASAILFENHPGPR